MPVARMTARRDFLAANKGQRASTPGFVLLVHPRGSDDALIRAGFTVTKKIGNAVVRNRLKRRLRALADALLPEGGTPGADHVFIGRADGLTRDFSLMRQDLERALARSRAP